MTAPKNKGGRPRLPITFEQVEKMRNERYTWKDIAEMLDISRRSAINIFRAGPGAKQAVKKARMKATA